MGKPDIGFFADCHVTEPSHDKLTRTSPARTEMAISNSQKCGLSSKANPELLKYAAMYVVLAAIVMGKGKVASCQPDADSPVKAIGPISNPVRCVKEAGVRAVVSSALVKSDSSNSAAHTGPELHSDGECRIVVPGRAWAGRSSPNRISRRRRRHRGWGALAATFTVSVMSGKPHPLLESRQTHWYSAHLTTLC